MSKGGKKINKRVAASAMLVSLALSVPIIAKSLKSEEKYVSLYAVPDYPAIEKPAPEDSPVYNDDGTVKDDTNNPPKIREDIGATVKYGIPIIPEKPRKKIIPAQPIEKPVIRSLYAVPDEPRLREEKFETREMPVLKYAPPEMMGKPEPKEK